MTIENTLERIATALEKIASGQGNLPLADAPAPVASSAGSLATAGAATVAAAPRPRGRPPKVQAPAPEPTTESAEPETEEGAGGSFLDVEDAATVYTIEQVREAIVGYQKKTGDPEKARKLLKTVGGVDTLRSLPESKFAAVIEACKK